MQDVVAGDAGFFLSISLSICLDTGPKGVCFISADFAGALSQQKGLGSR
jgi:hypothetical protein